MTLLCWGGSFWPFPLTEGLLLVRTKKKRILKNSGSPAVYSLGSWIFVGLRNIASLLLEIRIWTFGGGHSRGTETRIQSAASEGKALQGRPSEKLNRIGDEGDLWGGCLRKGDSVARREDIFFRRGVVSQGGGKSASSPSLKKDSRPKLLQERFPPTFEGDVLYSGG